MLFASLSLSPHSLFFHFMYTRFASLRTRFSLRRAFVASTRSSVVGVLLHRLLWDGSLTLSRIAHARLRSSSRFRRIDARLHRLGARVVSRLRRFDMRLRRLVASLFHNDGVVVIRRGGTQTFFV